MTIVANLTRGARPYGLIENVVTHTDYRRRGLGRVVVSPALERSWARRCYKVMLTSGVGRQEIHSFYDEQADIIRPIWRQLHDFGSDQHENRAKIVHAKGISVF